MANKGSPFERQICKELSLWYTDGKRDDIFWRTSGSGARATVRAKQGKHTHGSYGDVGAVDPLGEPLIRLVAIELKRGYPKAVASDVLDASQTMKQQQFMAFVDQASESAKLAGVPYWMIIHRRDRRQAIVTVPDKIFSVARTLKRMINIRAIPYLVLGIGIQRLYQIRWSDFQLWADELKADRHEPDRTARE